MGWSEEQFKERGYAKYGITQRTFQYFVDEFLYKRREESPKESYEYIPNHPQTVCFGLRTAVKEFMKLRGRRPRSFLEVGCGFGMITHFVTVKLKIPGVGIDIVPDYIKASRTFFEGKFQLADAFTYPDYGKFDLVYFYQPFQEDKAAAEFHKVLTSQVRGILFPYHRLIGTLDPHKQARVSVFHHKLRKTAEWHPFTVHLWDGRTKRYI